MKVIHYLGSFGFGGISRLVYDLIYQQNQRKNIEVAVSVSSLVGEFKGHFETLNAELVDFNLNSGYDLNPIKILKISKHFKAFDVLHLHAFHLSIALAALLSGKKIIYSEHGNFGFGRKIRRSDKLSFFFRKIFFKSNRVHICCNSDFTKCMVEKRFYEGDRIQVVYNGSSLESEINKQLLNELKNQYSKYFVIGVVGRLAGVKRIDKVIKVFYAYLKINPLAKLLIIGEGVEKQNLMTLVNDLNISDNVEFLGYQNEIMTYQSIFDVSIIGSKNEAFGLVIVESYLLKTPILAFNDGGGVVEIINRFESKDVCKDEETMVERLIHYNNDGFEWGDYKTSQLEFFSLKRMEQDYFNQYKAIV